MVTWFRKKWPARADAINFASSGRAAFTEGDYTKAATILEEGVKLDPGDQETRILIAQAYCGLKQYATALAHVDSAIATASR